MFRSRHQPPRLSRWSSCGTNQKPHRVISDQQEARVIMMTDQAVTRWWACGGGEGVSSGDRGQLLRWQICCINTENLIMNVWPMIPAHQAHDRRVMMSLHETYNKKTAVTLHLATMDAMYKKMKGSHSCGPSPVHLCKDLDAACCMVSWCHKYSASWHQTHWAHSSRSSMNQLVGNMQYVVSLCCVCILISLL